MHMLVGSVIVVVTSIAIIAYLASPHRTPKLTDQERSRRRARLKFVGHRGASATAPENTLAAFKQALAAVGAFEMDLSVLKDGSTVVVLHDETLRRTATNCRQHLADTSISSLEWHNVEGIDVGSWFGSGFSAEKLPTMNSALRLLHAPSTHATASHCYAELKSDSAFTSSSYVPSLPAAAQKAVLAEGVGPEHLTWISFSLPLCQEMKRRMPTYNVLLIGFATSSRDTWRLARAAVDAGLDGIDVQAERRVVSAELCTWMHERGKTVAVWVWRAPASNDHEDMWQFMADVGVEYSRRRSRSEAPFAAYATPMPECRRRACHLRVLLGSTARALVRLSCTRSVFTSNVPSSLGGWRQRALASG